MSAHRSGIQLTADEQIEIFGTTAFSEGYTVEAGELLGRHRRVEAVPSAGFKLTKQDWIDIKAENDALFKAFAQAKRAGVGPAPRSPTGSRPGTAPLSSGTTTAATRCTAVWWRCIWQTSGSPATMTTSSPGWLSSSTTSWSPLRLASSNPRSAGFGGDGWVSTFGHGDVSSHRPRRVHAHLGAGSRRDEDRHGSPRRTSREDRSRAIAVLCSREWVTAWPLRSQPRGDAVAAAAPFNRHWRPRAWRHRTPLRARIGLHTDEAVIVDDTGYASLPINRCSRLMTAAHGGQTVVSGATEMLMRGPAARRHGTRRPRRTPAA